MNSGRIISTRTGAPSSTVRMATSFSGTPPVPANVTVPVVTGWFTRPSMAAVSAAPSSEHALVAAMSFVKEGMQVPPRVLVAGVPARVVRELTGTEVAWKSNGTLQYQELARRSLAEMHECVPLAAEEAGRPVREAGSRPLSETRAEARAEAP